MASAPELIERGTATEGRAYDTGLRIRGLEVWARPPHHYRHYTTLFLCLPGEFTTVVYRAGDFCGKPAWNVGYRRPDGVMVMTYGSYESEEVASRCRETFAGAKAARLCVQFEVGYKAGGQWADKDTGRPWGTTWADETSYQPLRFRLTEEEAAAVLAFREEMDAAWQAKSGEYLRREAAHTEAVAQAAALDSLPASVIHALSGPTECLECGAAYDEPGHVDAGGMCCDQCCDQCR